MTLQLISLINKVQTIDGEDLEPFETQQRVGSTITSEIATAVMLKKIQCDVLEGSRVKWADAEGTALVKPTGASVELGGEGAAEFTSLDDAPATITPNGVVIGNDDGTALRMSDIISINENGVFQIVENGESGIAVTANGDGGFSVGASGTGGISLDANGGPEGSGLNLKSSSGVTIRSTVDAEAEDQGGGITLSSNSPDNGIRVVLTNGAPLKIGSEIAVATQSVLVAGVGTMTFTHGVLTGFTPA